MSGVGCLFVFPPLNNSKASPRRSSLPMLPKGPFFLCTILKSELQVIYTPWKDSVLQICFIFFLLWCILICFCTALLLFLPCLYYFLSTNFFPQCLWLCQLNVCEIIPSLWSSSSVFHLYVTIVKCTIQSYPLWETVIYSCHHLLYYVPLTMISICIRYINCMYVALALNQSVSKFWNSDFLINNSCLLWLFTI